MTHFSNGWRKQRSRPLWCRLARWGPQLCANPHEERISQHHERDMPVPCRPATNLILVQTHVFGIFKILFNMPSGSNGLDHLVQRGGLGGKDEIVDLLCWIADAATNEQPMASVIFPAM